MDVYILENNKPVKCEDFLEWAQWRRTADRRVANTDIGDVSVSTVFLGIDHSWGDNQPVLYETLIFGGLHDGKMMRYRTLAEAQAGHNAFVDMVVAS